MSEMQEPRVVSDGMVVTLDYILKVDDQVIDSSKDSEPIQFIQGQQHIIPGLEKELYGMAEGEGKEVVVSPTEGYGEVELDDGMDVPKSEFPPQIPLESGTELQLRNEEGETINARITSVGSEVVHLDFNHPLAGKELHFSVEVVGLRPATEEELEHGHVHDGGHAH
jgi:FKBP-type peptidyl-prolyl cis-trans isomerase SlyD